MKIVFCGPEDSGKSVFIASLIKKLPANSFQIIQAQFNGGGTFLYNPDQHQVEMVKVTSNYDGSIIRNWSQDVARSPKNIITLVDIDGLLNDDKRIIFQNCDYFVIISKDAAGIKAWQDFGVNCGTKCLAVIHSFLEEGTDIITKNGDIFVGNCFQLICGQQKKDSALIDQLAGLLVSMSNYQEPVFTDKNVINILDPAQEIGLTETRHYQGSTWQTLHFSEEKAPAIYQYFRAQAVKHKTYCHLYGIRPNWASAIACQALLDGNTSRVAVYDQTFKAFINIETLAFSSNPDNNLITFGIREEAHEVFLDVQTKNQFIPLESYHNLVLPLLPQNKDLYISGKLPLWLSNAIVLSYQNPTKYIFQPGNGFICIRHPNSAQLGHIVQKPFEIDIIEYFNSIPHQVVPFRAKEGICGKFVDYRDGQVYHWQKIGRQIWMMENLSYSDETEMGEPPNNDYALARSHGLLYTQEEAQAACPWLDGWQLPNIDDINELVNFLGLQADNLGRYAGCAPKLEELGFGEVKLAGSLRNNKSEGFNNYSIFWTSSQPVNQDSQTVIPDQAWCIGINANYGLISIGNTHSRFSVRCIKKD